MRIVFMGSGEFACPAVASLLASHDHELVAVVTQPDRPRGRKLELAACPVKTLVLPRGLPILTPEKVGDIESDLRAFGADLFVVTDYGQYVPTKILALPPKGAINIHPSLLPKYRGASPIPYAIASGDTVTGVTILYVTERMDAGDILLQREFAIGDDETAADLELRLSREGAGMLLEVIDQIQRGAQKPGPQDDAKATLAPKLSKEEGQIDWTRPASEIRNRIRAFQPWPGSFCKTPQGMLKVFAAKVEAASGKPGLVLDVGGAGPLIATGERSLRLLDVQPEGKKRMPAAAYINGRALKVGDLLPSVPATALSPQPD